MKTQKQLDWLAGQIIAVFEQQGFDQAYIDDTKKSLEGRDRFSILIWCNHLDSIRKAALAKRLNIAENDLTTTLKTLQSL